VLFLSAIQMENVMAFDGFKDFFESTSMTVDVKFACRAMAM